MPAGKPKSLQTILNALFWDAVYTQGYSGAAGVYNGISAAASGESFCEGFGHAYINNFVAGIAVNWVYDPVLRKLESTNHYRLWANLFTIGVQAAFLSWHYIAGTDDPLMAMLPNTAIGLAMTNMHVSKIKNDSGS